MTELSLLMMYELSIVDEITDELSNVRTVGEMGPCCLTASLS